MYGIQEAVGQAHFPKTTIRKKCLSGFSHSPEIPGSPWALVGFPIGPWWSYGLFSHPQHCLTSMTTIWIYLAKSILHKSPRQQVGTTMDRVLSLDVSTYGRPLNSQVTWGRNADAIRITDWCARYPCMCCVQVLPILRSRDVSTTSNTSGQELKQ